MQHNVQQAFRITGLSALALITSALASGQAHAAGFQIKENSVKSMGSAFAGAGLRIDDASVVSNNPATMALFSGTTLQTDLSLIDVSFEAADMEGFDILGQPLSGGNGGEAGDLTPVPAVSFVQKFDNGAAFGAMFSAPFGLKTKYDSDWVGRYFADTSDVQIVDLTLAGAFEFNDHFSVGIGAILSHADVTLSKTIDFGTILMGQGAPVPFAQPQVADGFANMQAHDSGFGWLVGANFHPTDKLAIGLSYRSEIDYTLSGDADWTVPDNVRATFDAVGAGALFQDGEASAKLTTPSVLSLDMRYQATDALTIGASYAVTDWTALEEVRIDFAGPDPDSVEEFNWDETDFWSIGVDYKLNESWTLRAGYAYDETPTTLEHRTPRLPDEDRQWYSLGATWNVNEELEVNFAYTYLDLDTPEIGITTPPEQGGHSLFGTYDAEVQLFGISGQYHF